MTSPAAGYLASDRSDFLFVGIGEDCRGYRHGGTEGCIPGLGCQHARAPS